MEGSSSSAEKTETSTGNNTATATAADAAAPAVDASGNGKGDAAASASASTPSASASAESGDVKDSGTASADTSVAAAAADASSKGGDADAAATSSASTAPPPSKRSEGSGGERGRGRGRGGRGGSGSGRGGGQGQGQGRGQGQHHNAHHHQGGHAHAHSHHHHVPHFRHDAPPFAQFGPPFAARAPVPPPPPVAAGPRELKVSSQSNPKAVAGSVSHLVREGLYPEVKAVGEQSVNQAIKAIAIARSYLQEEGMDICFQPELRDTDRFEFAVSLLTYEAHRRTEKQAAKVASMQQEVKVASTSNPGTVAGSIAGRVRAGERVCVQAIGATSVGLAVKSVAIARQYIYDDSLDLFVKPEFNVIEVEQGEQRSSIKLCLLTVQM